MKRLIDIISENQKKIESLKNEIKKENDKFIEEMNKRKSIYLKYKTSTKPEVQRAIKFFENKIERKLDYLMIPVLEQEFYKLLYYWEEFNEESAKKYKEYYKELYDEE